MRRGLLHCLSALSLAVVAVCFNSDEWEEQQRGVVDFAQDAAQAGWCTASCIKKKLARTSLLAKKAKKCRSLTRAAKIADIKKAACLKKSQGGSDLLQLQAEGVEGAVGDKMLALLQNGGITLDDTESLAQTGWAGRRRRTASGKPQDALKAFKKKACHNAEKKLALAKMRVAGYCATSTAAAIAAIKNMDKAARKQANGRRLLGKGKKGQNNKKSFKRRSKDILDGLENMMKGMSASQRQKARSAICVVAKSMVPAAKKAEAAFCT